jgi:hypothetical protein
MMRVELIRKLLETNHLNVPERRQLIPAAVQLFEVLEVIRDAIERECRFCTLRAILERSDHGVYRVHRLRDPLCGPGHVMDVSGDTAQVLVLGTMSNGSLVAATDDYPEREPALEAFIAIILKGGCGQSVGTIDGVEILGIPQFHRHPQAPLAQTKVARKRPWWRFWA